MRVRVVGPPSVQDCAVLVTVHVEAARGFLPCVAVGLELLAAFTLSEYF